MERKIFMFMLVFVFAVIPFLGDVPQANANDTGNGENSLSSADIQAQVERLEDEGEFNDDQAGHALTVHLTAVSHFEKQEATEKVVKHMNGFKQLLDHQRDSGLISESAYQVLKDNAVAVIQQWDAVTIIRDGQEEAVIVAPSAPIESLIDSQIPGWRSSYHVAGKVRVVDSKSYSGDYSLHINDDDEKNYGLESDLVEITGGKSYTARAMTYFESGTSPSVIFISFYDSSRNRIEQFHSGGRDIKGEWTEISITETAPDEAAYASIILFSDTIGRRSLYFDDVSLEQVGGDNISPSNPGFEWQYIADDHVETLVDYIQKSTGVDLPVMTKEEINSGERNLENVARIYVGESAKKEDPLIAEELNNLDDDGFVIKAEGENVFIAGPTDWGTEFGVYEFLERYVGVRWLMPGPDGEDVPQHTDILVTREIIKEEPAFMSRELYPLAATDWAHHNKMHSRIKFHHNLWSLFPPEKYAETHPEFYPGGNPPSSDNKTGWQPCFTAEGSVEAAVSGIIEYFDEHPDEISFSLGVNDSGGHCEADPSHPDYPGTTNSNGFLDMSDIYYAWVNDVVEQVLEVYPDKWFGLLAYRNVIDPPSFPLNPRVVPYITSDRMSWVDPDMSQVGKQLTEDWEAVAANQAWYEYLYGASYNIPRMYIHKMAENYRYAQDHNVTAHFAELTPNWGEGPKPWISARLQWDPDQDVDSLLNEWYTRAVGEDAAPYLQQYYEIWEEIWTTRMFESDWYQKWVSTPQRKEYLNFNSQSYLKVVTEADVVESRDLLETVVSKAKTEQQKKRAKLLLRSFEFYEASVFSYPRNEDVEPPVDEEAALAMLDDLKQSVEMAQRRTELMEEFKGDPILDLHDRPRGTWDGVQEPLIDALENYITTEPENGPVGEQLRQFLTEIGYFKISASAVKTAASQDDILQSLDFSEEPWVNAEPFKNFLVMDTTNEPPVETKVYLLWDDENLYVGYENFDDDLSQMIVSDDAPNGWWRSGGDDSVETYVTNDPSELLLGFFTNPKGVKFARYQNSGDQNIEWHANAQIGNDRWATVQVIPFSSIGIDPTESQTLQGFFFRNYHGHSNYLGWGGGAPWRETGFNPIHLVEKE